MTKVILNAGEGVTVIKGNEKILGIVVGKATNNISESYIIKCIDGKLPNDVYKYDTFIAQLYEITIENTYLKL